MVIDERVRAIAIVELVHIVVGETGQCVTPGATLNRVSARRPDDYVVTGATPENVGLSDLYKGRSSVLVLIYQILACFTVDLIASGSAEQLVVVVPTPDPVIPLIGEDDVIAISAPHIVIPPSGYDDVIATTAMDIGIDADAGSIQDELLSKACSDDPDLRHRACRETLHVREGDVSPDVSGVDPAPGGPTPFPGPSRRIEAARVVDPFSDYNACREVGRVHDQLTVDNGQTDL